MQLNKKSVILVFLISLVLTILATISLGFVLGLVTIGFSIVIISSGIIGGIVEGVVFWGFIVKNLAGNFGWKSAGFRIQSKRWILKIWLGILSLNKAKFMLFGEKRCELVGIC